MANSTSNQTYKDNAYTSDVHLLFLSIVDECNENDYSFVRLPLGIITIVMGFPANVALLWVLVRGEKALSPSDFLGLNLATLNIMFCLSLPLDLYISLNKRSGILLPLSEAFSILNLLGCPLLLTSMCVERYMAAAHAVLYMKIGGKWEYRVVCAAVIWTITFCIAVVTYHKRLAVLALYISVALDVFLLIMLACLIGIIRVLCKTSPGEGPTGGRGGSSIKSRALKNALMILIPSTIIYCPLLALFPYIFTLTDEVKEVSNTHCLILNLVNTFPSLGACIGPVFYMSRAKQLACWKKNAEKEQMTTQELQHPK